MAGFKDIEKKVKASIVRKIGRRMAVTLKGCKLRRWREKGRGAKFGGREEKGGDSWFCKGRKSV